MAHAELGFVPKAGVMVVFRSKRGDRIKVLFWDGSGIVMISPLIWIAFRPPCVRLLQRCRTRSPGWKRRPNVRITSSPNCAMRFIASDLSSWPPTSARLAFEDLETAAAEAEAAREALAERNADGKPRRPAAKRNLGHLPDHLPRIEQVIEPTQRICPCGCTDMVKIGEDRAERLDIVPARFQVIVTVRPRYACCRCNAGVIQADTPNWLIEGGLPTEGALAHVAVSKYADHLPLL